MITLTILLGHGLELIIAGGPANDGHPVRHEAGDLALDDGIVANDDKLFPDVNVVGLNNHCGENTRA